MKNTVAVIFLIILSATLYTLTLRGDFITDTNNYDVLQNLDDQTEPFESSHERGSFAHTLALVEHKTYSLNNTLGQFAYPDVGYLDGKYYAYFPPGISYMAIPFYMLGKQYGLAQVFTFGFISLMSILAIVFIFKIASEILKLPLWASILAPIIFAFGTTAWSYSGTLYQHHLTVFFILSGFYAAWRYGLNSRFSWAWGIFVWLNYALAITVDYPNAVLMLPVIIYFFISAFSATDDSRNYKINFRLSFLTTFIVFALITGAHLYHNKIYFGDWLTLSGELTGYKALIENNIDPNDPNVDQLIKDLGREKSAIGFFSEFRLVKSFNTLMFASDRGLFFFAPIFVLGIFGLIRAFRRKINMELMALLGIVAVNVFLYSSWGDPWGGWAYGPRYLILSMSVLSLFVAYYLSMGEKLIIKRIMVVPLFLYSSAIGLLGALTTNAVPPNVEAGPLGAESNFFFNIPFLQNNESGSFIYKAYLYNRVTLIEYFWIIFSVVAVIFLFLIFVMPRFTKNAN